MRKDGNLEGDWGKENYGQPNSLLLDEKQKLVALDTVSGPWLRVKVTLKIIKNGDEKNQNP